MPYRLLILLAVGATAAGCGPTEDVNTYKVPKPVEVPQDEAAGEYQILGAMFPDAEPKWFFKFAGKASELAPYAADFEKTMASVRFPNGLKNQPVWDSPPGWETLPGRNDITIGVIKPDAKKPNLEVTLSVSGGGAVGNLTRWAVQQLGNEKFTPASIPKATRPIAADKVTGTFVDLRGPKLNIGGPMMMGKPRS
ncbi:hypothetical protein [Limnoglobus roseus]|uniref:Lipoprotein n=1 Tax=Limnoglobus roseus TaxID=2598579 RepID=A0A5C1ADT2_9BACT|nr:hypothetical protein [Limnoglobus roseus]QEL15862.1 hypothetical protein PX52LOC_02798 [Limnoglobus roseus]